MNPLATEATEAPPPGRPRRRQRPHDSAATRQRIVDAAVQLLADHGFPGLGINSLASAAGVDKQLIYYHFGGLAGVVQALGRPLAAWLGEPLAPREQESYAAAMQRMLGAYARALRRDTLVQRLLAWELVAPDETLKALEDIRADALFRWAQPLRATAQPAPAAVDSAAVNALLLAGLQHLALRGPAQGGLAGVDLHTPEGAARIESALALITQRVYGGGR